jgi:hypothetical protein
LFLGGKYKGKGGRNNKKRNGDDDGENGVSDESPNKKVKA